MSSKLQTMILYTYHSNIMVTSVESSGVKVGFSFLDKKADQ